MTESMFGAARTNLTASAAGHLLVALEGPLDFDFASENGAARFQRLADDARKAAAKNAGQVQAKCTKTTAREYDPELLFSTPGTLFTAKAGLWRPSTFHRR